MIITNVNAGKKASLALNGTKLTLNNQLTIDLQALQSDTQQVVDVCLDNKLETMAIGLGAWYVANIIIPARQYDFIDEEQVARELDTNQVEVKLWALPVNSVNNDVEEEVAE